MVARGGVRVRAYSRNPGSSLAPRSRHSQGGARRPRVKRKTGRRASDSEAAAEAEHEVEGRLLLDVVVRKGAAVLFNSSRAPFELQAPLPVCAND